jgi:hypothetical protein
MQKKIKLSTIFYLVTLTMISSSYFQAREVLDHGCVMYLLFCKLCEIMMHLLGKQMHLWFAIKNYHVL